MSIYKYMKRWISFSQKMRVILAMAIVVIMLLVKDVIDKRNVTNLGTSFSSVYEDRLLPESYIYQMAEHLYHKKMLVDNLENRAGIATALESLKKHNMAINTIIGAFEKTRLTTNESKQFSSLKNNVEKLTAIEQAYFTAFQNGGSVSSNRAALDQYFEASATNLQALSGIQLLEAKRLTDESKRIVAGSAVLSRFEVSLLVIISLLLLALVFKRNINHVPVARPELN